jgi:acyl-[acyl-carrier-protein] desaturase
LRRSWVSRCGGPGSEASAAKPLKWRLAGIYDLRIHLDEVVTSLVRRLGIFQLEGLSPAAEVARTELQTFLEEMEASATKLDERRARSKEARDRR